jgi:hypothetical protein
MWCIRLIGLAAALMISALAGQAHAQEYCVACTEPNAVYRCVIEGARPGGGQSLQVLCMSALAKQGGHAACAIKRGTVFECDGPVKRVPWSSTEGPMQPQIPEKTAEKPEPDPSEPPKTLVEMTKQMNDQTAENMKKTGEAIKSSTKKTWDCVFSLFKQC